MGSAEAPGSTPGIPHGPRVLLYYIYRATHRQTCLKRTKVTKILGKTPNPPNKSDKTPIKRGLFI